MRESFWISGSAVLVGGAVTFALIGPDIGAGIFNPPAKQLIAACEDVIKGRLRSPSSYVRIEASPPKVSQVDTQGEYEGWDIAGPAKMRSDFADAAKSKTSKEFLEMNFKLVTTGKAHLYTTFIEYDAANGFGTPIRAEAICRYQLEDGDLPDEIYGFRLMVDGYTDTGWMRKQIADLGG